MGAEAPLNLSNCELTCNRAKTYGRIEKLLASLGSARFAMRKSGRIATFSEGGDPLVAVPPLRYNGLQEGAA